MTINQQNDALRAALLLACLRAFPNKSKHEIIDEIYNRFPKLQDPPQRPYVYQPEDVLTGDFGLFV